MKIQNTKFLKRFRAVTMVQFVSVLMLILFAWPILAQNDEDKSTDPVDGLDLFDEDVESTRKGWPQLYVSAGIMSLDADGVYSRRLPDGNDVTIIDFDRAGLKDSDHSYWFSVNWRSPNSRWGAWFGSWRYNVSGSTIWQESLELPNGKEIPVGAEVTSKFDAKWFILEATYSFYRSETVDTGIGFGIHLVDLDTPITARVQIGDRETEVISENLDVLAPLPNILAYVSWKFAPKWMLNARVGYFTLDYDKYSGGMVNAHAMLNYSLSPRWALGAGYQFVDLDLDVEKTDYTEVYDIDFSGPMVYTRFRF
jgi:hypothetical protein